MNSPAIIIYLVKVSIISSILYLIYRAFFNTNTYHRLNRFLLLFIVFFSLICPVLEISNTTYNNDLINYRLWINETNQFPTDENNAVADSSNSVKFSTIAIILAIYFLGVTVFLFRFIKQLTFIFRLRKKSEQRQYNNQVYYLSNNKGVPFSFFRWIFLPQESFNETILKHEKEHSKQLHSLDLIFMELYCIILWFNPFVFLLKQSLKAVHEYLADNKTIANEGTKEAYLHLLVNNIQQKSFSGITNHFRCLTIKNRIKMITRDKKSSKHLKYLYLIIIPVVMVLLFSFSTISQDVNKDETIPGIKPIQEADKVQISSGYGLRKHPITHEMKKHNGVDFKAESGTSVVATADGIVSKKEFLEEGKGYGRVIVITHSKTYSTLYSQLSEFKVELGDKVKQGDIIGLVGSSGISTGPHLHYEVYKNGENVNPEDYFK